jgi:hypothetical protein
MTTCGILCALVQVHILVVSFLSIYGAALDSALPQLISNSNVLEVNVTEVTET